MSGSKRKRKEEAMSEQKKPHEAELPPGSRATGQGPRPPETSAGDPKEKQADAPTTSENEQKKAQASRAKEAEKRATTDEGHLHPALQKIQAEHGEGPAPPAKLIPPPRNKDEGPPAATPSAPVAKKGDVPRFIDANERAPAGLARFRVRADNYGAMEARYVLAKGEEEAKAHYVRGLAIDRMQAAMGEGAPEPMLSVVKLPD